jgi:predicted DNA-binding protein (MmcQ/YjbR family)
MPPSPLARVRKICLALPGAHEVKAWGEPTFRVNNKLFAMFASANNHHGGGAHAIWVKSTPVNQSLMLSMNPKRFFPPPYVGTSGWVGVRLDGRVNWKELTGILRDAYELTVTKPKRAPAAGTNAAVKRNKLLAKRQLERR